MRRKMMWYLFVSSLCVQTGHARIDDLWEDALILEALDKSEDEKGLPLFFFGHSLGVCFQIITTKGLTALGFARSFYHLEGFKGIIVSAPALRFTVPVPGITSVLLIIIKAYAKVALMLTGISMIARYTDENKLEISGLCSEHSVREAFQADELVHERISLGLLNDIVQKSKDLFGSAAEFKHSILICHNEGDTFTDYTGSKDFIDAIGSSDKTFKTYPKSLGHELHNESSIEDELFVLFCDWMKARL
jgi:alpha-beta hydrolase superfamily lysophospholipase